MECDALILGRTQFVIAFVRIRCPHALDHSHRGLAQFFKVVLFDQFWRQRCESLEVA